MVWVCGVDCDGIEMGERTKPETTTHKDASPTPIIKYVQTAARALSAQSATEPAAAPLAARAWERALAILNEGLSCLYPPPAALAAAGGGGGGGKGEKKTQGAAGGGGVLGGSFAYAHHPEIAALLDRVAQVG